MQFMAVGTGGREGGGDLPPSLDFGISVTPYRGEWRGAGYAKPISISSLGYSDFPTALQFNAIAKKAYASRSNAH